VNLAKCGYKQNMKVRKFKHPSIFLASYLLELHIEFGHFLNFPKNLNLATRISFGHEIKGFWMFPKQHFEHGYMKSLFHAKTINKNFKQIQYIL
jgi:hypothetical protein